MSKDLSKSIAELNDSVKDYLQTKIDLFKLSVIEKISHFASYFIGFIVLILFVFLVVAFLFAAFAVWYGQTYDNKVVGILIASGMLVVLGLLFFLFAKKTITSNFVKTLSEIVFEENDDKD